jgi:dimethylargininase
VFVEDTAVVFDEVAVLARPGAASRRGEVDAMADALRPHRRLTAIEAPGTLDGGDVLVTPGRVFVGITGRTNADGARQLAAHIGRFGYEVVPVPVHGCLHLKSAVTQVASAFRRKIYLLINPAWIDGDYFAGFDLIDVDPAEPAAANVLAVNGYGICAEEHPRTRARLEAHDVTVLPVPAGELAKAEGGVTCCSVMLRASNGPIAAI